MPLMREWRGLAGSEEGLRWALEDLVQLRAIIGYVRRPRVAVQAGGNLGVYPKFLAKHFQTVYTFEPSPELFPLLCSNVPENNVVKLQSALGIDRRLVSTKRARRGWKVGRPAHEGVTHISGPGIIPTLRVDDLGLQFCDLLQLDVEGYELYALKGAVETLVRCRPVVAVEINENITLEGFTGDDVRNLLVSAGYVFTAKFKSDEVFLPKEQS